MNKIKPPEKFEYEVGGKSVGSVKLFALKNAIDKGMLSKEQALEASKQGMEQKIKGWIRQHKPITLETLTQEIRNDTKFLEQMERIDIHIADYEAIAQEFLSNIGKGLSIIDGLRARIENEAKFNKVGRNEPCPCGSGQKYKKCCGR